MPTYEYQCDYCGLFDIIQKMNDDVLSICPKCGGVVQRKISTGSGFILKGNGWPSKDYKKKGKA